jgi:hypothetical protein
MEAVILIMRFLFAFKLFLKIAIEVPHLNDGSRKSDLGPHLPLDTQIQLRLPVCSDDII